MKNINILFGRERERETRFAISSNSVNKYDVKYAEVCLVYETKMQLYRKFHAAARCFKAELTHNIRFANFHALNCNCGYNDVWYGIETTIVCI